MACGDTSLELTPKIEEILWVRFRAAEKMIPVELNPFEFHVRIDKESIIVNLLEKSCECRVFNVDKLTHAITAVGVNNIKEVYNHCSHYYKLNTWILTYAGNVYLIPYSNTWDVLEELQLTKVLPHNVKVKRGRMKRTQIPLVGEGCNLAEDATSVGSLDITRKGALISSEI